MSVREIVESQCPELRTRNSSDVMGASYKMPDTSAYLAKPHPFTISKSKDRDYLAPILKQKKDLPSPTQYDVTNSIIMKKNLVIYKTDRKSFCDDIAKKSKEVPGVGIYNPKTDEKIKGIFKRYFNFPLNFIVLSKSIPLWMKLCTYQSSNQAYITRSSW